MNLINNNTFNLKETPLEGDQIIPTSMIYKAKSTSSGTLEKLKARCCARGDLIKDPHDQDNWSSCASQRTVREFIATATSLDSKIKQLDFIGSYLQANMRGRMFIKLQPELSPFFIELKILQQTTLLK